MASLIGDTTLQDRCETDIGSLVARLRRCIQGADERDVVLLRDVLKTILDLQRGLNVSIAKPLSQLVKQRRTELGLSLRNVGKVVGVDTSLIWQIEVGRSRNPKVLVLYGLSVALNLPFAVICDAALLDVAERASDIG